MPTLSAPTASTTALATWTPTTGYPSQLAPEKDTGEVRASQTSAVLSLFLCPPRKKNKNTRREDMQRLGRLCTVDLPAGPLAFCRLFQVDALASRRSCKSMLLQVDAQLTPRTLSVSLPRVRMTSRIRMPLGRRSSVHSFAGRRETCHQPQGGGALDFQWNRHTRPCACCFHLSGTRPECTRWPRGSPPHRIYSPNRRSFTDLSDRAHPFLCFAYA